MGCAEAAARHSRGGARTLTLSDCQLRQFAAAAIGLAQSLRWKKRRKKSAVFTRTLASSKLQQLFPLNE
ncbi:hypothetical protein VTJ04DRAFT_4805 [Mycothermus thermophilus]|uniref:uncharacterized protein n=1 Tax=Humicola insolens TaxID=85995 RepID=UPI0037440F34